MLDRHACHFLSTTRAFGLEFIDYLKTTGKKGQNQNFCSKRSEICSQQGLVISSVY